MEVYPVEHRKVRVVMTRKTGVKAVGANSPVDWTVVSCIFCDLNRTLYRLLETEKKKKLKKNNDEK